MSEHAKELNCWSAQTSVDAPAFIYLARFPSVWQGLVAIRGRYCGMLRVMEMARRLKPFVDGLETCVVIGVSVEDLSVNCPDRRLGHVGRDANRNRVRCRTQHPRCISKSASSARLIAYVFGHNPDHLISVKVATLNSGRCASINTRIW